MASARANTTPPARHDEAVVRKSLRRSATRNDWGSFEHARAFLAYGDRSSSRHESSRRPRVPTENSPAACVTEVSMFPSAKNRISQCTAGNGRSNVGRKAAPWFIRSRLLRAFAVVIINVGRLSIFDILRLCAPDDTIVRYNTRRRALVSFLFINMPVRYCTGAVSDEIANQ